MKAKPRKATSSPDPAPRLLARLPIEPEVLFFRTVAAIALAIGALLIPAVGPNRFWLAGILLFVCIPVAIWLEMRFPVAENGWSEPLFDLVVAVGLVHLVPQMWYVVLVIGAMIVQAPSLGASRVGFVFHSAFAAILILGMSLAAIVHDVPGWGIPILAMTLLYPSIIFYSYWQTTRANELRDRAQTLQGLQLLSGGVAHDFNNLLTAVMGHAELALLDLPSEHPSREALHEVLNGANRASLLSARLLQFSGQSRDSPDILDIETEVRNLATLMKPAITAGITLRVRAGPGPLCVRADRGELQRVLMNLLLNAAEASDPGAEVRASIDGVVIEGSGDRFVRVIVADSGVGIPDAHRDRIFDPRFTSKERGHGLGLTSAKRTIRQLGGELSVQSVEGMGTEVELRLPAVDPPAVKHEGDRRHSPGSGGLALVIDDESPVRAVVAGLLAEVGFRTISAPDGEQAIQRFGEQPMQFSLVVVDLLMPGLNGWECLRSLREIRPGIPALVCSGFDPAGAAESLPPNSEFLAKPFRLEELRDALGRLEPASSAGS